MVVVNFDAAIRRIAAPAGVVPGDASRPTTSIAGSAALTLNCLPETLIMVLTMAMITMDGAINFFFDGAMCDRAFNFLNIPAVVALERGPRPVARRAAFASGRPEGPPHAPSVNSGPTASLTLCRADLIDRTLPVGRAKTSNGTGRMIPINGEFGDILATHRAWFAERFGAGSFQSNAARDRYFAAMGWASEEHGRSVPSA